jgi:hypothetical protein
LPVDPLPSLQLPFQAAQFHLILKQNEQMKPFTVQLIRINHLEAAFLLG